MGRKPTAEGQAKRDAILRALAMRYLKFDLPPTVDGMAAELGMGSGTFRYHVDRLRIQRLVHPAGLWITEAGLARFRELSTDAADTGI